LNVYLHIVFKYGWIVINESELGPWTGCCKKVNPGREILIHRQDVLGSWAMKTFQGFPICLVLALLSLLSMVACGRSSQTVSPSQTRDISSGVPCTAQTKASSPKFLPLKKNAAVINNMANNLNFTVANFTEGCRPTIYFSNMHVVVTPNNLKVAPESNQALSFLSTDNTVDITVDEIYLDEVVQENLGGVIANISVKASCRGIVAKIVDQNSVLSGVLTPNHKPSAEAKGNYQLTQPIVDLSKPVFTMTATGCDGAQGFEQLIETTIRNDLQNHELMSQLIQQNLISRMNDVVNQPSVPSAK